MHVHPTAACHRLLQKMERGARRAHTRTIEALEPADRARFIEALLHLVSAGNDAGRAPLRID